VEIVAAILMVAREPVCALIEIAVRLVIRADNRRDDAETTKKVARKKG
jgi:hypothetical protein